MFTVLLSITGYEGRLEQVMVGGTEGGRGP